MVSYFIKATWPDLGLVLNDTSPFQSSHHELVKLFQRQHVQYNQHGPQCRLKVGSAVHQSQTESLYCKQRDYSSSFNKQTRSTWFVVFQRNSAHLHNKACGDVTLKSRAVKVFSFTKKENISLTLCYLIQKNVLFSA